MNYYAAKQLAESFRTVRKNTIMIAEDIPEDQYGYRAVDNPKTVYELHATILHLMGLDYEKLTYRFNGRDMQLTDVHGKLIREILA